MSEQKKNEGTDAQPDSQLPESAMDKVAGGVSVGSFQVRGGGGSAGLAKIGDDTGTISEFVPKLTLG